MIEIVSLRLSRDDATQRFLLDGFPRTIDQAEALDKYLANRGQDLTAAILLVANTEEIERRLEARAKAEGRKDDAKETVAQRLEIYHNQTEPLVGYYDRIKKLYRVDGIGTIDEVFTRLLEALRTASLSEESTSS